VTDLIRAYKRCLRCGSPLPHKTKKRYCGLCIVTRIRESDRKYKAKMKKRNIEIGNYLKTLGKEYAYKKYDDQNEYCIDETHANWDTWIDPVRKINVKYLGTVSEWDLKKRIWKLKKQIQEQE